MSGKRGRPKMRGALPHGLVHARALVRVAAQAQQWEGPILRRRSITTSLKDVLSTNYHQSQNDYITAPYFLNK